MTLFLQCKGLFLMLCWCVCKYIHDYVCVDTHPIGNIWWTEYRAQELVLCVHHVIWWLNFCHQTCYKHRAVERLQKHSLPTCFLTWRFHSLRYVQYISVSVCVCLCMHTCAQFICENSFRWWDIVRVWKCSPTFRTSGENVVSGHVVNSKKGT